MPDSTRETTEPTQHLQELERIADAGESTGTPLVLLGAVWVIAGAAALVLIAIALLAYDLAK